MELIQEHKIWFCSENHTSTSMHYAENALNVFELLGGPLFILTRGEESSSRDSHVEEIERTEPIKQSWGSRLVNSVKCVFTTVLSSPEALSVIGLLALPRTYGNTPLLSE